MLTTRHFRTLGTATPAAIRAAVRAPAEACVKVRREGSELVATVTWEEDGFAAWERVRRLRYSGRRWR